MAYPSAQIDPQSEFEWRDKRVFLMEPDGTTVVLFVGEVATD